MAGAVALDERRRRKRWPTRFATGELERARALLPTLVGRSPVGLDSGELARAVVESVAENTVDAIVAPVFWTLLGGAPAVFGYRALNTLDAMVGHRSLRYARFGWASARADDVAAWVPARITALPCVAAVRPWRGAAIWKAVRTQAPAHPSPNAGVAEAAFAAALGISLGGTNDYEGRIEHRPVLGAGRGAHHSDIYRARRLSRDVTIALGAACLVLAGAGRRRLAPGFPTAAPRPATAKAATPKAADPKAAVPKAAAPKAAAAKDNR